MANENVKHKSAIGKFLWSLPILKSIRGAAEFKAVWRGLRIVAVAAGLGLVDMQFGGIVPPELLTILSPMVEKYLREQVDLFNF